MVIVVLDRACFLNLRQIFKTFCDFAPVSLFSEFQNMLSRPCERLVQSRNSFGNLGAPVSRVLYFYQIQFCISIKYKFRFNVSSCVHFLPLPNKKRLVTTRSDRRLPCEVSFYKIHPRLGCPGENDLEIVLLCFGKYHA